MMNASNTRFTEMEEAKMKVIILLANGFEEVEAIAQIDFLRRAGIEIDTVSIHDSREIVGQSRIIVIADKLFSEMNPDFYDAVILPGGKAGMLNLQQDARVQEMLVDFHKRGKVIAAICASPSILGKLHLLDGRRCVCYPGFESNLTGASVVDERVVIDGTIITSKGPGTSFDFAIAIIKVLGGTALAEEIASKTQM